MGDKKPRYFERPDDDQEPLGFWQTLMIVMSSHLGVRPRDKRHEDFRRANGLHVFVAGVVYFVVLLVLLVVFVNWVSRVD
ncbi:DUF2970 domain-containing protein [Oceanicoccus sagamiensis]|uniref:DUF2970 domain-containing protein n=1 Tax=Oceanicoccus sagamiensis TaxID=716816 RepID=A0A1X9N3M6_9GAMM|nr:DUF2970 domain-containing protein [Oceanicoccus sagamiensis]ARN72798.1 hypothetical protein BST96_00935 [Oceanicoccus sagamiensis]